MRSCYSRRQLYNKVFVRHRSLKDGLLNEEVRFSTIDKIETFTPIHRELNKWRLKGEGKNYEVPQKCNFFQNSF